MKKIYKKKAVTSSKLIIALYASAVCVYTSCTCLSSRLECNSRFIGLGGWCVRGAKNLAVSRWMIKGMGSMLECSADGSGGTPRTIADDSETYTSI